MKAYPVDHVRGIHKEDGDRIFMRMVGRRPDKPIPYPNLKRPEKHKTTHANVECDYCDKTFSAKKKLKKALQECP